MARFLALLALGFSLAGSGGQAAPPAASPLVRVVVIGASASAGAGIGQLSLAGGDVKLADVLQAAILVEHAPVRDLSSTGTFLDVVDYAVKTMERLAEEPPSAVVAIDYLFWFVHGMKSNADRESMLAKGLKGLEQLSCPLLLGDLPDVTRATQVDAPMILPSMVPAAKVRDAANVRIREWAKGRRNVVLVPFAELVGKVHAGAEIRLRGNAWKGGEVARLLQPDLLHPSVEGLVAIAVAIVDAWLQADPALPAKSFELDVAQLVNAMGPKLKSAALKSGAKPSVAFGADSGADEAPEGIPGWVRVNCAPGTFTLKDGVIVSTGKPTGVLRSETMHENFTLEVEWRHLQAGGNAGIFVWSDPLPARGVPFTRSIEVQVLDGTETENYTSHGDLFSIHGATCVPDRPHPGGWARCLPTEKRAKPSPEWNHYLITAKEGRVELAVNGKVVSGVSQCSPRKGYLCLEAEGSETHFRNLKLTDLPDSVPPVPAAATASEATPVESLYTGIDLEGWEVGAAQRGHWSAQDWVLAGDGKGGPLATSTVFGDVEVSLDWRLPAAPPAAVKLDAAITVAGLRMRLAGLKSGEWNRLVIERADSGARGPITLESNVPIEFANLFVRRRD